MPAHGLKCTAYVNVYVSVENTKITFPRNSKWPTKVLSSNCNIPRLVCAIRIVCESYMKRSTENATIHIRSNITNQTVIDK